MTTPPRPRPLTGSAGLWAISKPGFAQLANTTLGDAGTPADGFESSAAGVLNALNAAGQLLDAITRAGDVLTASTAALDAIKLGDIDQAIAAAQAASSPMLGKIATAVAGTGRGLPASPTIGSPPSPPIISSGCGGTAGSSGGGTAFQEATYTQTVSDGAAIALQGLINSGAITSALAPAIASALPIIGAAIGVAILLAHYLGKGCGEACIDAAKAEQVYEAAADDVMAVYRLGMITAAQAVAIMVHLFSAGTQHMGGFNTSQANKGAINMQKVISALIAQVPHTPQAKQSPLNLTTAHENYVSGPGWYPDSLAAAGPLADEYLQALAVQKGA